MDEEAVSTDPEQDDRSEPTGLTAAVADTSLLEDTAAKIGVPPAGRDSLRGFRQCIVPQTRSEEHTSELQSLMRISYAVFCLKKKKIKTEKQQHKQRTTLRKQEQTRIHQYHTNIQS